MRVILGREESPDVSCRQRFAEETLRTLCVASREVSEAEFRAWSRRHREAAVLLQDRAQELDRLYEEMEQNLQVGWGWGQDPNPNAVPQRAGTGGLALQNEEVKCPSQHPFPGWEDRGFSPRGDFVTCQWTLGCQAVAVRLCLPPSRAAGWIQG